MRFGELLGSARAEGAERVVRVGDEWTQGRSVFGGLQAAILLEAMRGALGNGTPLRTMQVTFAAPVPAGEVRSRAKILRSGKSATHVQGELIDGANVLCSAIGVFGAARESSVLLEPRRPPVEAGKVKELRFIPGVMPNFLQHFVTRWLRGGPPFTGNPSTIATIEADLLDERPAGEAHLLAIADLPPPLALSMLKQPAPGSSMTWTIEIFARELAREPLAGWRLDVEMIAAREGYISQSVMVWAPAGQLAAISRQSMVVFA